MKPLISSLIAFSLLSSSAMAQSLSTKIYDNYTSLRAMGMGNAFTAVADDYSLIFYNPAGFAKKKHNEIQFSLAGAGYSPKTLSLTKDVTDASNTQGTDSQKAQAVSDALEKYYGQAVGGRVQALELFWIRKNWGFALLPLDLSVDMSINRQVGPAIDLNVKGDTTAAIGGGGALSKEVDMGITAKYVHRVSVEQIVPAFELATDSNVLSTKRMREGTAADFDVGFMWTPGWFNHGVAKKEEVKSETIAPAVVAPAPTPEPAKEVKTEDIKPADPVAEKPADAPKKEDTPAATDATKPAEEVRAPQAEGDATEVKTAETPAATPAAETPPATPNTEAKDVDAALENKPAPAPEVKPEATPAPVVAQPEEKKPEEVKPIEDVQHVQDLEESYPLSFGLVVHNVIGGEFTLSKMVNKDATEVPTKMYRVMDVGSQYKLYDGGDLTIRYMLDFKDLFHPEITFNKAFHTGLEFDYSPSTWFKTQFRVGVNQMYYTAGASFLFGIFDFDLVTYGEEVGTVDTHQENRVYAAKVAFNF